MGEIDKDPAGWWKEASRALQYTGDLPKDFGFGSHANGFTAVTNHHADNIRLLAFGHNSVSDFGFVAVRGGYYAMDSPEEQVAMLRVAAEDLGYGLTRLKKPRLRQLQQSLRSRSAPRSARLQQQVAARLAWIASLINR
jgi:hypothetical protein